MSKIIHYETNEKFKYYKWDNGLDNIRIKRIRNKNSKRDKGGKLLLFFRKESDGDTFDSFGWTGFSYKKLEDIEKYLNSVNA